MGSLKTTSLRQELTQLIRKKILKGEYLPGERINEAEIAAEFNISRGPVREAIRQLEQEGLAVYQIHKGCSVKTLSADDAWEIYLLRSKLESLALELCSGQIPQDALRRMESYVSSMKELDGESDIHHMVELDNYFHSEICKASEKRRLFDLWSSLNSTSYAVFLTVLNSNVSSLSSVIGKHERLLATLKQGDMLKSCGAITDHYLLTGERLYRHERAEGPFEK